MMETSLLPTGVPVIKRVAPYIAGIVVAGAGLGYAVHEHNSAQTLANQNAQVTAQLNATHGQLDAMAAKINSLAASNEAKQAAAPAPVVARKPRPGAHRTSAQDARFKKMQSQLDAQGKEIADARNDLASAKTELGGSIAKTHDELVTLEKKGERNYYEFDLSKSKQFKREGPVGLSLRKANEKHQYADLQLMVDDRNLQQKHVNLYQPAMFYQPDSAQPIEIVINEVTKNHIHGYVSAPKYRQSELAAASDNNQEQANSQPPARKKLTPLPADNEPNQQ